MKISFCFRALCVTAMLCVGQWSYSQPIPFPVERLTGTNPNPAQPECTYAEGSTAYTQTVTGALVANLEQCINDTDLSAYGGYKATVDLPIGSSASQIKMYAEMGGPKVANPGNPCTLDDLRKTTNKIPSSAGVLCQRSTSSIVLDMGGNPANTQASLYLNLDISADLGLNEVHATTDMNILLEIRENDKNGTVLAYVQFAWQESKTRWEYQSNGLSRLQPFFVYPDGTALNFNYRGAVDIVNTNPVGTPRPIYITMHVSRPAGLILQSNTSDRGTKGRMDLTVDTSYTYQF